MIKAQVIRCINIGLLFVQDHQDDRPIMETIVSMLFSDLIFPSPSQPAFSQVDSQMLRGYRTSRANTCSRNIISETVEE